jgi:hypothetical protein
MDVVIKSTKSKQKKGSNKGYRFGNKQKNGSSRAAYFVTRNLWRAAKNKARRIAKAAAQQKRKQERKQQKENVA